MYFLEFMPRMTLVVRAEKDAAGLAAAVRGAVHSVDRDQPVSDIRTMENIIKGFGCSPPPDHAADGLFAAIALVLAGIGLYG